MTLIVRVPLTAADERAYAVDLVLSDWLGLEYELVHEPRSDISLTTTSSGEEVVVRDVFLSTAARSWLHPESLPVCPLPIWHVPPALSGIVALDLPLPVLFGVEVARGTYLDVQEAKLDLGLDVFGSAFFMLSRYEEVIAAERDVHGRFPDVASVAVREGFMDRPLVNEYVEVLWSVLRRAWPRLTRRTRSFRFLPSHDIDHPFCREPSTLVLARRLTADVVRRHDINLAARRYGTYRRGPGDGHRHDLCDTYEMLMDLSEEVSTKSAFHFFGERSGRPIDGDYAPHDGRIQRLLQSIGTRGHEIGLHASYHAQSDAETIRRELAKLQDACDRVGVSQSAWGSRHHYLRWEAPATWAALARAGLDYDASVGYPTTAGFRAGCCWDYPVYDVRRRHRLDLRERPLVAMDVALLDRMKLTHSGALTRLQLLRDRCRVFEGNFTLLWHNSRLKTQQDRWLYESTVRSCA